MKVLKSQLFAEIESLIMIPWDPKSIVFSNKCISFNTENYVEVHIAEKSNKQRL